MTHALLLVGGWAAKAGTDSVPPHFGALQGLALALTAVFMAALWLIARRHQRELRARRDASVVPFPDPSRPSPPARPSA